jgi:hypothetical protein
MDPLRAEGRVSISAHAPRSFARAFSSYLVSTFLGDVSNPRNTLLQIFKQVKSLAKRFAVPEMQQ